MVVRSPGIPVSILEKKKAQVHKTGASFAWKETDTTGGTTMYRFLFAAMLSAAGLVGFSQKADAQYYGYQTFVPGAGIVVGGQTMATPFGARTMTGYYSPFTGLSASQSYYANAWGGSGVRLSGYNPYTNFAYRSSYGYNPLLNYGYANSYGYNPYINPYSYGMYSSSYAHRPTYIRR
jgi:hypothetical protein